MPYMIVHDRDRWCVHKKNDDGSAGENRGCSDSRKMAVAHMRALYAHEKKEIEDTMLELEQELDKEEDSVEELPDQELETGDAEAVEAAEDAEDKAVWSTASVNDLPDSAFLYIEAGGKKDGEGKTTPRSLRHLPVKDASGKYDIAHVRNAIARIPQMKGVSAEKKQALQARARSILSKLSKGKDIGFMDELIMGVSDFIKSKFSSEQEISEVSSVMLWKEGNRERFLVRYSNNFRDDDRPAQEIISSASHQHFVRAVENKEAAMPELWLWHVPEWRLGECDWVAYDESGFALASGLVDVGKEAVAEQMAAKEDTACSHGMPKVSIERDTVDPTVITKHITTEISLLPRHAAANKYTGFILLGSDNKEEEPMAIPAEKRAQLEQMGIEPALLDQLEAMNLNDAAKAQEEGRDTKEAAEEQVEESAVSEQAETPAQDAAHEEVSEAQPTYPTIQEVADAFATIVTPLVDRVTELETQLLEVSKQVTEVAQDDEEKVKDRIESIPPASLAALLAKNFSAVGKKETQIDGRSSLAKAAPQETEAQPDRPHIGIPFLDKMLSVPENQE